MACENLFCLHQFLRNLYRLPSLAGAPLDAASLDAASLDAASPDAASPDSASLDGASLDGASLDGASLDGASLDDALLDAASPDAASHDSALLGAASLDAASLDAASLDAASPDAASLAPLSPALRLRINAVYYTTGYVLFCCPHTITSVTYIQRHNRLCACTGASEVHDFAEDVNQHTLHKRQNRPCGNLYDISEPAIMM